MREGEREARVGEEEDGASGSGSGHERATVRLLRLPSSSLVADTRLHTNPSYNSLVKATLDVALRCLVGHSNHRLSVCILFVCLQSSRRASDAASEALRYTDRGRGRERESG